MLTAMKWLAGGAVVGIAYAAATAFSRSPRVTKEAIAADGGNALALKDGRLMEYFIHGDANGSKTILALPGANTTGNLFSILGKWAESKNVRIVSPSLPGFGLSEYKDDYTLEEWVGDATELLRELKITECYILGTSLGSIHAAALACLAPASVHVKDVMLYVAMAPESPENDPLNGSMLDMFGKLRSKPLLKRLVERLLFMPILRAMVPKDNDVYRSVKYQWEGGYSCAYVIYQPWNFPWRTMGEGRHVYVVSGSDDTVAPRHNQEYLVKNIKGSTWLTYTGAHEYPIVHPEVMIGHVEQLVGV